MIGKHTTYHTATLTPTHTHQVVMQYDRFKGFYLIEQRNLYINLNTALSSAARI